MKYKATMIGDKARGCVSLVLCLACIIVVGSKGLRSAAEGYDFLAHEGDLTRAISPLATGLGLLCLVAIFPLMLLVVILRREWLIGIGYVMVVVGVLLCVIGFVADILVT